MTRKGQKKAAATANSSRPEQNASLPKKQRDCITILMSDQDMQLGFVLRAINMEQLLWNSLEDIYDCNLFGVSFDYDYFLELARKLYYAGYVEIKHDHVRITAKGIRTLAGGIEI